MLLILTMPAMAVIVVMNEVSLAQHYVPVAYLFDVCMLCVCVSLCVDKNYDDAVSKLESARIEWEQQMSILCKVGTVLHPHFRCLVQCRRSHRAYIIMAALWNRAGRYIFALWFLLSFLFFTRLISAVADWMSTILLHIVWP